MNVALFHLDIFSEICSQLDIVSITQLTSSCKSMYTMRRANCIFNRINLYKKSICNKNWNIGLALACENGDKCQIQFFIEKGADNWNVGMMWAAEGGHRELVDFFIAKGANDWNYGLMHAAGIGHKELVEFFIKKGANNWNYAMISAAQGGHKELVEFINEKAANHFNYAMVYASEEKEYKELNLQD
jgi:ankyrin repeat protein